ncbi:hypothetical protein SESBI_07444 [Sesbania bispinosa]|nr:hypothetical protein SESBI_07444 [Sesbania bispinosa]
MMASGPTSMDGPGIKAVFQYYDGVQVNCGSASQIHVDTPAAKCGPPRSPHVDHHVQVVCSDKISLSPFVHQGLCVDTVERLGIGSGDSPRSRANCILGEIHPILAETVDSLMIHNGCNGENIDDTERKCLARKFPGLPISVAHELVDRRCNLRGRKAANNGAQVKRRKGRSRKEQIDKVQVCTSDLHENFNSLLVENEFIDVSKKVWKTRVDMGTSGLGDDLGMGNKLEEMEKRDRTTIGRTFRERE